MLRAELIATFGRGSTPLADGVRHVAFGRGNALLASASGDEAQVDVCSTGELRHDFEARRRVRTGEAVFTQAGTAFFLRDDGTRLECRRIDDGTLLGDVALERRLTRLRSADAGGERVVALSNVSTGKPETLVVSTVDGHVERVLSSAVLPRTCVAFSDGRIAVALQPSGVELWSAGSAPPEIVRAPAQEAGACEDLAVSADGKWMLACWSHRVRRGASRDRHRWIELIETETLARRPIIDGGPHGFASPLAISRDGARVAFGWETSEGMQVFVRERDGTSLWASGWVPGRIPTALAFSDDARHLAVGCKSGEAWPADLQKPASQIAADDHRRPVRSLSFSLDGAEVLALTEASSLHAHDVSSGLSKSARELTGAIVQHAARREDGSIALLDASRALRILEPADALAPQHVDLPGPVFVRGARAVSVDARHRIVVTVNMRTGGSARIGPLYDFPAARTGGDIRSGALSADGVMLALTMRRDYDDDATQVWHLGTRQPIALHRNLPILRDVSPSGRVLGVRDGELVLVEPDGRVVPGPGVTRRLIAMAVTDDSSLLAAWTGAQIDLWNLDGVPAEAGRIATEAVQPKGSGALAFSRDGKLLAAGGSDRRVRVWKLTPA